MVFNSLHFVAFFLVVYALYRVLPFRAQNVLLLAASYYFYAAWDWRFVSLLVASTLVDYAAGLALGRASPSARAPVHPGRGAGVQSRPPRVLQVLQLLRRQPPGASFALAGWHADAFTVTSSCRSASPSTRSSTMSYVIDVYRKADRRRRRSLIEFGVFVGYFPHLVAGPILRASLLLPQIRGPARSRRSRSPKGVWLLLWGYFKKMFVADNLARVVAVVFDPGVRAGGSRRRAGHGGVRVPDLRRLLRILGHRPRPVETAGHRAEHQLPLPVLRADAAGVLGALAHQPVDMAARLPVPAAELSRARGGSTECGGWGCATSSGSTAAATVGTMLLGGLWHGAAWTFVAGAPTRACCW